MRPVFQDLKMGRNKRLVPKMNERRQGPTQGVLLIEVSVKRELTLSLSG